MQIVFQDPYASLDPRQSGFDAIDEVLRLHRPMVTKVDRAHRIEELGRWSASTAGNSTHCPAPCPVASVSESPSLALSPPNRN